MFNIKISVFTNNDEDRKIIWPSELSCRPIIGDNIQSLDGKAIRKICGITHRVKHYISPSNAQDYCYLEIEVKR